MRIWAVGVCVVCLLGFVSAVRGDQDPDLGEQRDRFVEARSKLKLGDERAFLEAMIALQDYPLHRYLRYEWLLHRLDSGHHVDRAVEQFVRDFGGSSLAQRLRQRWLRAMAREGRWTDFLKHVSDRDPDSLRCLRLEARHATGQLSRFDRESRTAWLSAASYPQRCERILELLEEQSPPDYRMVWKRIAQAIKRGNTELVKRMTRHLNERDKDWAELWLAAHNGKHESLSHPLLKEDSLLTRKILRHGIHRIASQDAQSARELWLKLRDRYVFTAAQRAQTDRYIALSAAYDHLPEAFSWLDELDRDDKSHAVWEWQLRAALRNIDWPAADATIRAMPEQLRKEPGWRYWRARAAEELGKQQKAKAIYVALARQSNYYGFLAADRLNLPYPIKQESLMIDEGIEERLLDRKDLLRAREYLHVGLPGEARLEWNHALREMTEEELRGAAVLASQWGWHERAIHTAARAGHRSDFAISFPMPYKAVVTQASKEYRLEPALVYAVMRQESAYMADVTSRAGAVGLMQLMPATAQMVAQRLGRELETADLLDIDTNVQLGTYYLRDVLNQFDDHQILAAAAYNAGPHRVSTWLPVTDALPADVWVETIPYKETRRYAKAVMTYVTIFEWRMGHPMMRLRKRMAEIGPRDLFFASGA